MDSERIVFPNSDSWWEIKRWLTRGDRRKIDQHIQHEGFAMLAELKAEGLTIDDIQLRDQQDKGNNGRIPTAPSAEEDDAMLLYGTTAWSWEDPISLQSVQNRREDHANMVLQVMRNLYRRSEEQIKN